jgi:agmatine/peptidylarginine deiminase
MLTPVSDWINGSLDTNPLNDLMLDTDQESALLPEWAEQSAVLLAWPYAEGDFNPWLQEVEKTYRAIAGAIIAREALIVLCRNEGHRKHIEACLALDPDARPRVRFVIQPYNDVWVRDTAPLTVTGPEGMRLLDFRFNGWGGKYEHAEDARLAHRLAASGVLGHAPLIAVDFVLEGGSVEMDGEGTLLTTRRCLLNPNRNPTFSQAGIEECLRHHLGAERVLWLAHGHAEGDDTDAHIDTLARFCSSDTIAYTACDRPEDPMYREFQAMEAELGAFVTHTGEPYHLVALPMPLPVYSEEGERLPATYANFLIINGAVLVPGYEDPADEIALSRLRAVFPDREIVPINCLSLIRQYGSLHCMTMQFPAQTSLSNKGTFSLVS